VMGWGGGGGGGGGGLIKVLKKEPATTCADMATEGIRTLPAMIPLQHNSAGDQLRSTKPFLTRGCHMPT
jgi:hypothetical protein